MQITISIKDAELVKRGLADLGAEIPRIGRQVFFGTAQRIQRRMKKYPPTNKAKVNWDSEKQRRAYFATDGFGHGIPYTRSGGYARGFEIVKTDTGYRIENKQPGAVFVGGDAYGNRQSRIHKNRWPLFRDIAEQEIEKLPEEIQKNVAMVIRRRGFGG